MKAVYIISIVVITSFLVQCKNSKKAAENNKSYKQLASEKLGEAFECTPCVDGTFVLCQSKRDHGVNFFVFDNNLGKIVHEDSVDKGTVDWHSENELALFYTPGTMRQGQSRDDYTFIYHLKNKQKTRKTELN